MDDLKPSLQDVFLSFGIGAIISVLLLVFTDAPQFIQKLAATLKILDLPDAFWIPVSAASVFILHLLGRIAISIGQSIIHPFKIGSYHSNKVYVDLVVLDNSWLWKRYQQKEQVDTIVFGAIGIFGIFGAILIFATFNLIFFPDSNFPFSWDILVFVFGAISLLIMSLKKGDAELEHLLLIYQKQKFISNGEPPIDFSLGNASANEVSSVSLGEKDLAPLDLKPLQSSTKSGQSKGALDRAKKP